MTPLGLPLGTLVRLARQDAGPGAPSGPIVVVGTLAPQLARTLAAGGEERLVRADGDPGNAAVLVCVLGGEPTAEQLALLRRAARDLRPTVAVQTGQPADVPYVPAGDVVDVPPGRGFPVDEIAAAIARVAGEDAAALAERLPAIRPAVVRTRAGRAVGTAAAIASLPWAGDAHLPQLVPLQARLVREVSAARGEAPTEPPSVGGVALRPELGIAVAVGVAGRALVRALPVRGALVRAAVAAGATLALAAAASRGALLRRDA